MFWCAFFPWHALWICHSASEVASSQDVSRHGQHDKHAHNIAQHWISLHAGCNQSLAGWLENFHHVHPCILFFCYYIKISPKARRVARCMTEQGVKDAIWCNADCRCHGWVDEEWWIREACFDSRTKSLGECHGIVCQSANCYTTFWPRIRHVYFAPLCHLRIVCNHVVAG